MSEQEKPDDMRYCLDGRKVALDTLCRHEPAWAANRIRELNTAAEEWRAEVARLCALCSAREQEIERLREIMAASLHCGCTAECQAEVGAKKESEP